jgi:hypothetical protein
MSGIYARVAGKDYFASNMDILIATSQENSDAQQQQ